MNSQIFKISLFTITLFSFFIISCGSDSENSKAHQEVVKISAAIENFLATAEEQVEEMKDMSENLMSEIKLNQTPGGAENSTQKTKDVLDMNQSIAKGEGIIKNLKTMIEQHAKYIERHENSALAISEIKAQHNQIKDDFLQAEKEMVTLKSLFNQISTEYKKKKSES